MNPLDSFTVERIERIIINASGVRSPTHFEVSPEDMLSLAKIALAAKQAEKESIVVYIPEGAINRLDGEEKTTCCNIHSFRRANCLRFYAAAPKPE